MSVNAEFAGTARKVLISGGSAGPAAFAKTTRTVLVSANGGDNVVAVAGTIRKVLVRTWVPVIFAGAVRKVLLQTPFAINPVTPLPNSTPTGGPIPVFPSLPQGFPVNVNIVMDTTIGTTKSLRELRLNQQNFPLWDIELLFEELLDQTQNQTTYAPFVGQQEYETLVQNWLMLYGQTGVFAFTCPWDYSRSNQAIGTGDGNTFTFTIYRTWGISPESNTATIGCINAVTQVQVSGVTVAPSQYYAVRNKLYFVDAHGVTYPPAAGAVITMTFTFYYLCRFVEDEQDFEEFAKNRWAVKSLKFRAVYWP